MKNFNDVKQKNHDKLELYVPVVARVHGQAHPEFHEVHKVYNTMVEKMAKAGSEIPELHEEFQELRRITTNYEVPTDTCESYEAVYDMLSELDEAYSK